MHFQGDEESWKESAWKDSLDAPATAPDAGAKRFHTFVPPRQLVEEKYRVLFTMGDKISDVSLKGILGEGGQGVVFRGREAISDTKVVVKAIPLPPGLKCQLSKRSREIYVDRLLSSLFHDKNLPIPDELKRNIELPASHTIAGPYLWILFNFSGNGDLVHYLMKQSTWTRFLKAATPNQRVRALCSLLRDVMRGLRALKIHLGLNHNDVKTDNLLLTADGRVKLSDLGIVLPSGTKLNGPFGTPGWRAPELSRLDVTIQDTSDINSASKLVWFLISGIVSDDAPGPELETLLGASFGNLIRRSMDSNPTVRPNFDEILIALDTIDAELGSDPAISFGQIVAEVVENKNEVGILPNSVALASDINKTARDCKPFVPAQRVALPAQPAPAPAPVKQPIVEAPIDNGLVEAKPILSLAIPDSNPPKHAAPKKAGRSTRRAKKQTREDPQDDVSGSVQSSNVVSHLPTVQQTDVEDHEIIYSRIFGGSSNDKQRFLDNLSRCMTAEEYDRKLRGFKPLPFSLESIRGECYLSVETDGPKTPDAAKSKRSVHFSKNEIFRSMRLWMIQEIGKNLKYNALSKKFELSEKYQKALTLLARDDQHFWQDYYPLFGEVVGIASRKKPVSPHGVRTGWKWHCSTGWHVGYTALSLLAGYPGLLYLQSGTATVPVEPDEDGVDTPSK